MATIRTRKKADGSTSYLVQIRINRDKVTVYQESQTFALEDRLQEQGKTHWQEMNDAQKTQARLRGRRASADLRFSVLVDAGAFAAPGCDSGVLETAGTGGLVHGAELAQLDRAHAQRIVAITDDGDRELIALEACQAYVREVIK